MTCLALASHKGEPPHVALHPQQQGEGHQIMLALMKSSASRLNGGQPSRQVPATHAMLCTWCVNGVPMRRSPDIERYTISSNGRLGRLLLDAELSPGSASKAEKDQVGDTAICRLN